MLRVSKTADSKFGWKIIMLMKLRFDLCGVRRPDISGRLYHLVFYPPIFYKNP